ncbi:MAG: hypothetical protein EOP47_13560 [Sphingobacteriaceae bacterium]|nr:MAG: hypothetical protein EOP47_13560 [Sphingobacteriaceae bacterium]
MVPVALGLLFCFFSIRVSAQSPAAINVSDCGTSTTLTSTTIPGYSNLIWDNGSTATSRVVNASGAYWWQVTGANVVTNGNFSSGNTGFTSQYTYRYVGQNGLGNPCCGVLSAEGTYAVDSNPRNVHTNFSSFTDHTNGSGNMLIVNGSPTNNVTVWTQNIPIIANTDYVFSVWVTSASPANPAQLQFSINGSQLGTTIIPAAVANGTWQYFTTTWNSGNVSGLSIPIALVNKNIVANGNDFAIDDIVFAPVYRQNINVTLNPIPVLTLTPSAEACGVYNLVQTILGYDNVTYAYVFKDSQGNVITNPTAVVQSGVYTITAQNRVTGCTSLPQQTTITINPNPQKPGITSL